MKVDEVWGGYGRCKCGYIFYVVGIMDGCCLLMMYYCLGFGYWSFGNINVLV